MVANKLSQPQRMIITRVFDAPRELVWKAWTESKYAMQWWGPKGFTAPVCEIDFRVGGKFHFCMRLPDGQEFWTGGEYHEIILYERIAFSMYFSNSNGDKVDASELGIDHQAIEGIHDVITFENLGNGQTKVTFTGNETMEDATNSGQLEGLNQSFDKFAGVLAELMK
jgi:uncharacterized protein YndB with AHSA1/START domain